MAGCEQRLRKARSKCARIWSWAPMAAIPIVREKAGLEVIDLGAPIDVLWMRVSRAAGRSRQTLGRFRDGRILVMLDRGDYWQCAYVIRKGRIRRDSASADCLHFAKISRPSLRFWAGASDELKDWDDIKLLSVARRSPAQMVASGAALHWRFRARDVAGRRRGHQSRDSGRGRRGEYFVAAAVATLCDR